MSQLWDFFLSPSLTHFHIINFCENKKECANSNKFTKVLECMGTTFICVIKWNHGVKRCVRRRKIVLLLYNNFLLIIKILCYSYMGALSLKKQLSNRPLSKDIHLKSNKSSLLFTTGNLD